MLKKLFCLNKIILKYFRRSLPSCWENYINHFLFLPIIFLFEFSCKYHNALFWGIWSELWESLVSLLTFIIQTARCKLFLVFFVISVTSVLSWVVTIQICGKRPSFFVDILEKYSTAYGEEKFLFVFYSLCKVDP